MGRRRDEERDQQAHKAREEGRDGEEAEEITGQLEREVGMA